jgi:hypothetical protein
MEAVLMDAASVALLHGERGRDEVWWSFALCALGRALLASSSSSSSSSASLAALLLVGALLRADSALLCGLLVGGAGALWPSWALPLLCGASGSWRSALSALVALLLLSTLLQHLQHQHNMLLLLSEWEALAALAPSVSLHWYFFAELFRPFGAFFAALWLLLLCASLLALARSGLSRARALACALLACAVFAPRVPLALSATALLAAGTVDKRAVGVGRVALLVGGPIAAFGFEAARRAWLSTQALNVNFVYATTLLSAGAHLAFLVELAAFQRPWMG